MKLIIDISEEEYNLIKIKSESNIGGVSSEAERVIAKGIPLPKGHGRLIDADKTLRNAEEVYNASSVKDIITSEQMYATRKTLTGAPTIIEADKDDE